MPLRFTRSSALCRDLFLKLDTATNDGTPFLKDYFNKHKPDWVLTTSLGFNMADAYALRAARKLGVQTATVILSWDNTSTKGMAAMIPDQIITWTTPMSDELKRYHGVDPSKISCLGIAHFDVYHRPLPEASVERYMTQHNLKPSDKYLFLGTGSPTYLHDITMESIEIILTAIERGDLDADKLVVRFHPLYVSDRQPETARKAREEIAVLEKRYPNILVVNYPENISKGYNFIMPESESELLTALIQGSSVLISFFSTLMLEAALCDIPIVNVAFDSKSQQDTKDNSSAERYTHIQRILSYQGTSEAHSPDELISIINHYLKHPELKREGRQKMAEVEGGPNKGQAGKVIGEKIYELVSST